MIYATDYEFKPFSGWYICLTMERWKSHWWGFGYRYEMGSHCVFLLWWKYELYIDTDTGEES
jgi:hypothetical protein